jgi:hypothetical protein
MSRVVVTVVSVTNEIAQPFHSFLSPHLSPFPSLPQYPDVCVPKALSSLISVFHFHAQTFVSRRPPFAAFVCASIIVSRRVSSAPSPSRLVACLTVSPFLPLTDFFLTSREGLLVFEAPFCKSNYYFSPPPHLFQRYRVSPGMSTLFPLTF